MWARKTACRALARTAVRWTELSCFLGDPALVQCLCVDCSELGARYLKAGRTVCSVQQQRTITWVFERKSS